MIINLLFLIWLYKAIPNNILLAVKNIKNEIHRLSLFPSNSIVSMVKNNIPEIIIIFLNNLTLSEPINTPSSQKATVAEINIR
jgi:hypothetical protein